MAGKIVSIGCKGWRDADPLSRNSCPYAAGVAEAWGGTIDCTPDTIPVISPVDTLPGFFLATGFSGHGFGIGPAAGKLAADIVTGATPLVDPVAYSHKRMIDGRRLAPVSPF